MILNVFYVSLIYFFLINTNNKEHFIHTLFENIIHSFISVKLNGVGLQ